MVEIPKNRGRGFCLNGRCFDRETLRDIVRTDREKFFQGLRLDDLFFSEDYYALMFERQPTDPYSRKSFVLLDDLDRAFRNAAWEGKTALVERLLAVPGIDVNAKNKDGDTALMKAADRGHTAIVRLLLAVRGIKVNAEDEYGDTAMISAVRNNHADIVKMLIDAGADVNRRHFDRYGYTALMSAAENGYTDVVAKLLAAPNIDVNMKSNTFRETALFIAVRNGTSDIVELLLDKGADVNTKNKNRISALVSAAANGKSDIVRQLLDKGADVNKKSAGVTALISAAKNGETDIVKLLIDAGADVNAQNGIGWTALMFAIRNGRTAVVKQLLAAPGIDVNVRDEDDKTALDWAAESNDAVIVDLLTEAQKRAAERAPSRTTAEVGTQTDRTWRVPREAVNAWYAE